MSEFRLAFSLALGTLRSRPTLTVLAIGLLAIGTTLMGGLSGTVYLLKGIQAEFLSALTIEIELANDSDSLRTEISELAESWPGAEFVQYVSPATSLREVEQELGENVSELFGTNPFPPIIRVRFGQVNLNTLDSLTCSARRLNGVTSVVFPKQLWNRLNELMQNVQGSTGWVAILLALAAIALVGLCLRAQVRYRLPTWELISLMGISERTLGLSLLVQEGIIGLVGGLLACLILYLLTFIASWLLLHEVGFPLWFYLTVWLAAVALTILAGIFSPRRFES
ncbi:permease-like cell division protein FtsX [bacterium]|nr:permease-like cell division protein FtsX [bacterium]MBU1636544.1 permease-like cell division protein FtsX [bacterium]MBU1919755.1 permease-like cell division protein FtsX [bacterium]